MGTEIVPNFFLNLRDDVDLAARLREHRLERAIGMIYLAGHGID